MLKMKFEGGAELAKALDHLPLRTGANVMRAALRQAAEPIRSYAASIAPRAPGAPDIADNIVVSTARVKEEEAAAVKIGPARGFAYGLPLEIGTAHMAAQPFMRPAFDAKAEAALGEMNLAIRTVLIKKGILGSRSSGSGGGLL